MKPKDTALDLDSEKLIKAATDTIKRYYKSGKHHVACALLTSSGKIYPGIHLDCAGYDTCAEPTAIAQAVLNDESGLELIVAVMMLQSGEVEIINPCGNCLQHFLIFAPNIEIVTNTDNGLRRLPLKHLMPYPYAPKPKS